jgi:two-component system OmpR family response regulator
MLLEEGGYDVLIAASGETAIRLFSCHSINLVLLDYGVAEMNGDVVAERMKADQREIPIVMLSAEEGLSETTLRPVDVFVSKSESPASCTRSSKGLSRQCDRSDQPSLRDTTSLGD